MWNPAIYRTQHYIENDIAGVEEESLWKMIEKLKWQDEIVKKPKPT